MFAVVIAFVCFTARRVCIARTMLWQLGKMSVRLSVRLSAVCPSHAGILSKRLNQTGWQYSDGNPIMGRRMQGGMKKITIFDQHPALSRK